ncbi:MAG: hypothetical protein KF849_18135 [Rhizobiaceae bacterium]|nr:hypothetical protein [Rhizobiaceae bacterium]
MKRTAAAFLFFAGLGASPAHATGDISCTGEGVSVDMLVGRLQVLSILRTVITLGDETWSSDQSYVKGTPITVGQAFEDDRFMAIDFMDDNLERIVGRIRVVNLDEISAGAFSMDGKGSWIVDCSLRG